MLFVMAPAKDNKTFSRLSHTVSTGHSSTVAFDDAGTDLIFYTYVEVTKIFLSSFGERVRFRILCILFSLHAIRVMLCRIQAETELRQLRHA